MKLDFILSETIGGSVLGAIDEIATLSLNNSAEILVIVPEDSSLMIEKLLLEKRKALSNVHVYSFVRLLEKLDISKKDKYISRENAILIVRKIIIENYDKLVCFKKSAKSLGFAELIYDTISQFKASRISPAQAQELANNSKPSLRIKLHDIALIYTEYQNFLLNHYLDSCDKLDLLIDVVKSSEFIKNCNVYFVGFDSLTSQGTELCEVLAKVSCGVKVACSFINSTEPNHNVTDNELYEKVKRIADKHHLNYVPKMFKIKRNKTFSHLEKNLFAYPYSTIKSDNRVIVFEGVEPRKEIEFVATQIYNDISSNKINPSEVAIVCPDLDSYENYFQTEFLDRNLPIFINKPQAISSHPLFSLIKKSLECVRKNFESDDMIVLSKNTLFEFNSESDVFENFVLRYGINHYGFLTPFEQGKLNEKEFKIAENVRQTLVINLLQLKNSLIQVKTTQEFCQCITTYLEKLNINKRLEKLYSLQLNLDMLSAKVTEQVKNKLDEIINGFCTFLNDVECDLEQFITLFDSAILAGKINVLPLTLKSIVINQDINGISPKIKQLYCVGVLDGVLPFRKDDCGLIADSELGSLSDLAQKKIEPTIRTVNKRERFKAYNMLLLPSEKLVLTYSVFNLQGEENKPSSLIDGIIKLFESGDLNLRINTIYDTEPKIANFNQNLARYFGPQKCAEKKLLKIVKLERENANVMNMENVSSLYYALKDNLSVPAKFMLDNINKPIEFEKIDNANQLYFKNKSVSISELEKYFTCPLQHFAVYGLGLKERPLGGIKALDVGNILHLVAEKFEKRLNKITESNLDFNCDNILNESLKELEISKERNGLILSILSSEARRLCRVLYKESKNSSFKTVETEFVFGNGNGALTYKNGIRLVGKVDRIDVWDNYFKIIDYKTGNIAVSPADIYYGRKIQLISYLLALDGFRNLKPAGVLYFPIRNEFADGEDEVCNLYLNKGLVLNDLHVVMGIDNSLGLDNPKSHIINAEFKKSDAKSGEMVLKQNNNLVSSDVLNGLMKYVYSLSEKAIEEILCGNAIPSPLSFGSSLPCDYCPLAHTCGVDKTKNACGRKRLTKITNEQIAQVMKDDGE